MPSPVPGSASPTARGYAPIIAEWLRRRGLSAANPTAVNAGGLDQGALGEANWDNSISLDPVISESLKMYPRLRAGGLPSGTTIGGPAENLRVLLHEGVHTRAPGVRPSSAGYSGSRASADIEEGGTEALAQQYLPAVVRALTGGNYQVGQGRETTAYPDLVSGVRQASAKATGSKWTSPTARRWLRDLMNMPEAQRPAAYQAALDTPRRPNPRVF